MLKELRFVQGAVAKKDFIPTLKHFVIENGEVRGYNGVLALCSPIPFDISCKPKADLLVKAIGNCDETIQLAMTPAGRLSVKSGSFKTFIECVDGETPHATPEGTMVDINGEGLLTALKAVEPFIGDDASRPWSNGVNLTKASAFATNNVCLVEYWLGAEFPVQVNLPRDAVREMVRIGEAPTHAQYSDHSITFHYADRRWIRTQLLPGEWPDLGRVLNKPSDPKPIDKALFTALDKIKPFVDKMGRVYFEGSDIRTHIDNAEEGASFEIPGFGAHGVYAIEMLRLLEKGVERIDWSSYPRPCLFFGGPMRGAIIGMHMTAKQPDES